jgi:hypothetical protein
MPRLAKRHRQNEGHQFYAGVVLADAGIRHVVHTDPEAAQVLEAIGEFRAGAELGMRPEIGPSSSTAGLEPR